MVKALLAIAMTARGAVETVTETAIGATDTFEAMNPCTVTVVFNAVPHITAFPTGEIHITGTQTGDFVLVPSDPALPTYTGHFAIWFGGNINSKQAGFWNSFNIKGTGSDGSTVKFQAVQQFHVSATGVTIEFMMLNYA